MSDEEKDAGVSKLIHDLKKERDELKVQVHLGKMELKEDWQSLADKLDELNRSYDPLKEAVGETADDVWDSLKLVGSEIADGFRRIRKSL